MNVKAWDTGELTCEGAQVSRGSRCGKTTVRIWGEEFCTHQNLLQPEADTQILVQMLSLVFLKGLWMSVPAWLTAEAHIDRRVDLPQVDSWLDSGCSGQFLRSQGGFVSFKRHSPWQYPKQGGKWQVKMDSLVCLSYLGRQSREF